ncbi:MAG: glycoside hydrolase family 13 protein [Anaerolineae bacterium]|nr:glycoside hydrolase family 13 protein [Anaerolineae bacterium]
MSEIHTPDWVKDAVFYQIFPDRFATSASVPKPSNLESWDSPPTVYGFKGGDLLGVAEHLDYLVDLGVDAIYFNPIFQSAANHRYHTHDYYNVDPILGGNTAFRALLDQAHRRGIRIVLDGVFNHASRGFFQFNHILENGPASPYVDWFYIKGYPLYAYDYKRKPNYVAWAGLRALPKFNTDNPAVREFIFGVAEHWIRQGIDGWRLDVPAEINDDAFWQEFRRRVKAINPEAYIVGEIWHESQRWLQGDQFDAVMNYLFTMACLSYFVGGTLDVPLAQQVWSYRDLRPRTLAEFAAEIDRILGLYHPEVNHVQLNLLDSHDTPRFLTLARGDESAFRLATLFQMTYPGAPCIYYGDEIGMEGGHDPDCRRAFPWDESRWNHGLRDYVKRCVALRKAHRVLRRGDFRRLLAQDDVYAFARTLGGEVMIVLLNAGRAPKQVALQLDATWGQDLAFKDVWSGEGFRASGSVLSGIRIPPREGRVLSRAD